jgi:hypothetical protein
VGMLALLLREVMNGQDIIGKSYVIFDEDWLTGGCTEYDLEKPHIAFTVSAIDDKFVYYDGVYNKGVTIEKDKAFDYIETNYWREKV